jgi:hypothetical protein
MLRIAWIALIPAGFVGSGEAEKRCFAISSCSPAARDPVFDAMLRAMDRASVSP